MIRIMSYEVTTLFSDSPNVEINLHDRMMTIKSPTFSDVPLFHCVDKPSPNAPVSLFCHPKDESYARSVTAGMVPFIRHFARQSQNFLPYSQEENAYMAKQVYRFFKMSAVKRSMGCEWCEESQGVISDTMTSALHSLTTDARFTFELKEVAGAIDGMSRAVDNKQGETVDPPSQYQTNEEDSIKTFREMTTEKKGPQSLSNTIGKKPLQIYRRPGHVQSNGGPVRRCRLSFDQDVEKHSKFTDNKILSYSVGFDVGYQLGGNIGVECLLFTATV